MNHSGETLSQFFQRYRKAAEPLVLATIAETLGSTYRKAGAQMLIARDGSSAGLLSGGCLESDLMERALQVLESGRAVAVEYDTRSSDDILWGIGLGCEGAMRIVLSRLDATNDYQPFAHVEQSRHDNLATRFALIVDSRNASLPLGTALFGTDPRLPASVREALLAQAPPLRVQGNTALTLEANDAKFLIVSVALPIQLLLLGAGPDAMPVAEMAGMLDWHVSIIDHRPAYATVSRFPSAKRVLAQPLSQFGAIVTSLHFDAAVVMSHHLTSDAGYLAALARTDIPYIGLLGPAPRRARLMADIGAAAALLADRLHGPIGLDIGANSSETIALAIVSEIQAVLAGKSGGSFSGK